MQKIIIMTVMLITGVVTGGFSGTDVKTESGTKPGSASGTEAAARPGREIRKINLNGQTLVYRLLDLSERGEMVKLMGHHEVIGLSKSSEVTNHLMVYIQGPGGKAITGDVAFLLRGPDGKDFRTMTMGMYGGYGADVTMNLKGTYTIRTKIITEGGVSLRLDDEFVFQVR